MDWNFYEERFKVEFKITTWDQCVSRLCLTMDSLNKETKSHIDLDTDFCIALCVHKHTRRKPFSGFKKVYLCKAVH